MNLYVVKYKNDHGKTIRWAETQNKQLAEQHAKDLVESKVWIDVYSMKKVRTIRV